MRSAAMTARILFALGFAAALLTAIGCGGGSDGGTTGPSIGCSDGGAPPANGVAMTCAGATAGSTEQVNLAMTGPTSGSTTLRGINVDVTYDPTKLNFAPATSYGSPLFPDALIAVTLYNGQEGRVVVSIQQPQGQAAVAVPTGQSLVLTLEFTRVTGTTFAPTPVAFENTEATSASAPISFASALALSYL